MSKKEKRDEALYLTSAFVGGVIGLLLTAMSYFIILAVSMGASIMAWFVLMLSFGMFLGLLSAYCWTNLSKVFKVAGLAK